MTALPRLLYLGHNLPYPPHEGALIRSYHTVRLLSRSFQLTGMYFFRRGTLGTESARTKALEEMGKFGSAQCFAIPQEESRVRFALDHLRSLASGSPYTRWMYDSGPVRTALEELLGGETFDLVHVDSLDLLAYLPRLEGLRVVLAHHNVESALLRRRAATERGIRRAYLRLQAHLLERAERRWCSRVALNVAVSDVDARILRTIAPDAEFLVVPNGVDVSNMTPSEGEPDGGVLFVGGYSWFPNADGMRYFAQEILPLVRKGEPRVPVRWIGRTPSEAKGWFETLGVEMLGYVEDVGPELARARCIIVPLRIGGGTRLKILDAWAMGKAVVSTSVGCEGLEARNGENILVADEAEAFATSVLNVLQDPRLRRELGRSGRATAERAYDWEILGSKMTWHYHSLLKD